MKPEHVAEIGKALIKARKKAEASEYRCVNGHDRCAQSYPSRDCPYCELTEPPQ